MQSDEKEVTMTVASEQTGGTRKRRPRRARKTRSQGQEQEGGDYSVEKADAAPAPASATVTAPAPAPAGIELAKLQAGGAKKPIVVIAPAKKKPAKVMLVPKSNTVKHRLTVKKTFKARRVRVRLDNTAKTRKRQSGVLEKVDKMTDEQVRSTAVRAKLSRQETVAKAPIGLLREMTKDYLTMRGMFL